MHKRAVKIALVWIRDAIWHHQDFAKGKFLNGARSAVRAGDLDAHAFSLISLLVFADY